MSIKLFIFTTLPTDTSIVVTPKNTAKMPGGKPKEAPLQREAGNQPEESFRVGVRVPLFCAQKPPCGSDGGVFRPVVH